MQHLQVASVKCHSFILGVSAEGVVVTVGLLSWMGKHTEDREESDLKKASSLPQGEQDGKEQEGQRKPPGRLVTAHSVATLVQGLQPAFPSCESQAMSPKL